MCVLFAGYLLVEQGLANRGSDIAQARYPIDGVDGEAEKIGQVLNG
jgi:hypothetical protein